MVRRCAGLVSGFCSQAILCKTSWESTFLNFGGASFLSFMVCGCAGLGSGYCSRALPCKTTWGSCLRLCTSWSPRSLLPWKALQRSWKTWGRSSRCADFARVLLLEMPGHACVRAAVILLKQVCSIYVSVWMHILVWVVTLLLDFSCSICSAYANLQETRSPFG